MTPRPPTTDEKHAARRERVWPLRRLVRVERKVAAEPNGEVSTEPRIEEAEERLTKVEGRLTAVEAQLPVPRLPSP